MRLAVPAFFLFLNILGLALTIGCAKRPSGEAVTALAVRREAGSGIVDLMEYVQGTNRFQPADNPDFRTDLLSYVSIYDNSPYHAEYYNLVQNRDGQEWLMLRYEAIDNNGFIRRFDVDDPSFPVSSGAPVMPRRVALDSTVRLSTGFREDIFRRNPKSGAYDLPTDTVVVESDEKSGATNFLTFRRANVRFTDRTFDDCVQVIGEWSTGVHMESPVYCRGAGLAAFHFYQQVDFTFSRPAHALNGVSYYDCGSKDTLVAHTGGRYAVFAGVWSPSGETLEHVTELGAPRVLDLQSHFTGQTKPFFECEGDQLAPYGSEPKAIAPELVERRMRQDSGVVLAAMPYVKTHPAYERLGEIINAYLGMLHQTPSVAEAFAASQEMHAGTLDLIGLGARLARDPRAPGVLYQAVLGRAPSAAETANYFALLASGVSYEAIHSSLSASAESAQLLCLSYLGYRCSDAQAAAIAAGIGNAGTFAQVSANYAAAANSLAFTDDGYRMLWQQFRCEPFSSDARNELRGIAAANGYDRAQTIHTLQSQIPAIDCLARRIVGGPLADITESWFASMVAQGRFTYAQLVYFLQN